MKFCLYTPTISPHQVPLAAELVRHLGAEHYRYVYQRDQEQERKGLGWSDQREPWMLRRDEPAAQDWLSRAPVLMSGIRDVELFKARSAAGLKTIYCAERWFKPIPILGERIYLDGRMRMLSPRYRAMARAILDLYRSDLNFHLYPMGVHAARDFAGLLGGRIRSVERRMGGRIDGVGFDAGRMRLFGYAVAPTRNVASFHDAQENVLRILWVGRMLKWKHLDVILKAASETSRTGVNVVFDIYGAGSERASLVEVACALQRKGACLRVQFHDSIPESEVRNRMREHDVYVLGSDAREGWGAVVSEANEERMCVFGTHEAGSSATMLPVENLYHYDNVSELAGLLRGCSQTAFARRPIPGWSAVDAANALIKEFPL